MVADRRRQARDSFERRIWGEAFAELSAAHREGELEVEDLERLAVAAYMVGRDDECEDAWMGAHREWLRRGEGERAARCTFWQALGLFFRGDLAPAMGWVARGRRILEDGRYHCVEQAWLLMLTALPVMFQGDAEAADPSFLEAGEIAERFGDSDATMFARLGRGQSLILQGRIAEGMALLDEVMVAVTADEVSPVLAGIAYCQVIALCQTVFDLRRAREWTEALSRWCDSQPDLVPYRGNCLVHRCEIFQLQGAWRDALDAAQRACEWLSGPPAWDSLGSAYYQLAEIQRLCGESAHAEESYRKASLAGREPEPGMSLLRLAQGRIDLALPAIRRVTEEAQDPHRPAQDREGQPGDSAPRVPRESRPRVEAGEPPLAAGGLRVLLGDGRAAPLPQPRAAGTRQGSGRGRGEPAEVAEGRSWQPASSVLA